MRIAGKKEVPPFPFQDGHAVSTEAPVAVGVQEATRKVLSGETFLPPAGGGHVGDMSSVTLSATLLSLENSSGG